MESFFCRITEDNKLNLNKPVDSDMVYYSELNEWFSANAFRSFSIKYVLENYIHYKVGRKEHIVKPDTFLLACKQPQVKAYFDSDILVKSICIDIRPEMINEAFTVMSSRDNYDFDNYQANYFTFPNFFESVTPVNTATAFNKKLKALVKHIAEGTAHETIDREWFYDLVEGIIYHEHGNFLALNGIHSVKTSTKKEILQRLKTGREFMDENFLTIHEIAEVASACNFSDFHFFRSFRQAFAVSPYQYLLNKRLELARTLLSKKELSINRIAAQCNFIDLATFSKAFKRQYGVSPTHYSTV